MLSVNNKNNKILSADEIISRMMTAIGGEQKDLANVLGITSEAISAWKKRSTVPASAISKMANLTGKPTEWYTGQNVIQPPTYADNSDPDLARIVELWPKICADQRKTMVACAEGFAKLHGVVSPAKETKVKNLIGKKSA